MSECVVAGTSFVSMSSGAAYLTIAPDDTVATVAPPLISPVILAISKSQICGLPLPMCGQLQFCEQAANVAFTSSETRTFVCTCSAKKVPQRVAKTHAFDWVSVRTYTTVESRLDLPLPCVMPREWR